MNPNSTSIGYRGEVVIKTPIFDYYSHNNGTNELFKLLNRFMAKQSVSVGELPGYLTMYNMSSSIILSESENAKSSLHESKEIFSAKVPAIANIVESEDGSQYLEYTSPLASNNLKPGSQGLDLNSTVCLSLISSDKTRILAATDIVNGGQLVNSLQQGMTAVVKWKLSFENPVTGGNN